MEKKACGCGVKTKAKFNEGLTKDAKAIVSQVEGYDKVDKAKRSADVRAAFGEKKPAAKKPAARAFAASMPKGMKTTKVVAKPAPKDKRPLPKPAGISKGPHSGDQC